uniref:Uncharacterized protein n=1 Tax=Anguilla anguilla TaxID=7936 RepID=A0A0E9P9E4_ANGAN
MRTAAFCLFLNIQVSFLQISHTVQSGVCLLLMPVIRLRFLFQ